ncbi:MAG: hypothetical protein BGO98_41800 [Myxococcales bacterium 68-20]|nr:MAG: hypothetical protein BGO98_41800 [Myxococcales bacterium 68-20]
MVAEQPLRMTDGPGSSGSRGSSSERADAKAAVIVPSCASGAPLSVSASSHRSRSTLVRARTSR